LAELEAFQILTLNEVKYRNKGLALALAAKYDAGPLFSSESLESLFFSSKDGSTYANTSKIFLVSRIQILIQNQFENINNNIYNIKYPTDECFESSFSSIRAKMAALESIENLKSLYTKNYSYNYEV
jgi:hypothetical protein